LSQEPLISFEAVSFSYASEPRRSGDPRPIPALRDVNLKIWSGEYVVVLGRNGSGKSTLARHCNALLVPTSGRVLIDGRDSRDDLVRPAIRDAIGMIFQNPDNQIIATVVEDDIAWSLAARHVLAEQIRARVSEALTVVGLANSRGLAPHRLSDGQRQRLAIASALVVRPRALIADEPTALLDPMARRDVARLLRQLNRETGLTVVHVTHLLEEAAGADRVIVLDDGKVVLTGAPAMVFVDLDRLRRWGLAIPEPLELADRLRAAGWPISPAALSLEAIANEMSA